MVLEYCPNCQKKLHPPLRSSNRQVCTSCGWTDKPNDKKVSENYNYKYPKRGSDYRKDYIGSNFV